MSAVASATPAREPIPDGAVFLSYAREDSAMALRIATALRAAGIAVWFDQNELRGGDAWDEKIRRQIKECALFLPIVSANTQQRAEGYFRLEWRLADQRTHLMGRSRAFLLPVCVDGTAEDEADVPDSFLSVQWTRLPGGEAAPEFCARVRSLLTGERAAGAGGRGHVRREAEGGTPAGFAPKGGRRRETRWTLIIAGIAVTVGAGALWFWRGAPPPAESAAVPTAKRNVIAGAGTAAGAVAPAQRFIEQARRLIEDPMAVRESYFQAEDLAQRAAAIEPDNGTAWAVLARASLGMIRYGYDTTPQRREEGRKQATRARQLAPQTVDTVLAWGLQLITSKQGEEAERFLREAVTQGTDDRRVWLLLADGLRSLRKFPEAREIWRRLQEAPGGDLEALNREIGHVLSDEIRYGEVDAMARKSLALAPSRWGYFFRLMAGCGLDDLDDAKAVLESLPAELKLEDSFVYWGARLWMRRGDGEKAEAILRLQPRDFIEEARSYFPKGYLAGWAAEMEGRTTGAQAYWAQALIVVEKRRIAEPTRPGLAYWRALLLALTGRREEAAEAWKLGADLGPREESASPVSDRLRFLLAMGRTEEAIQSLPGVAEAEQSGFFRAAYHFGRDPEYAAIRAHPKVQAIIAAREEWTLRQRNVARAATRASAAPVKTIAVLPFENLSVDKANEYFSDGISDEISNVLGKVPGLRVAGRASAFSFKGRQVTDAEIAAKLGVALLLTGTVQTSGNQVRIRARLTSAADGFQVWSERFTRELKDIFAVQDEIATLIAGKLELELGATRRTARSVDPEAHRLVLEGRFHSSLRTKDGFARAEEAFGRALDRDPGFAEAHAGLAEVGVMRANYATQDGAGLDDGRADLAKARVEAQRAIALDAENADAPAVLGYCDFIEGRPQEAERWYRRALEIAPNRSVFYAWRAMLRLGQGRLDEGLSDMEKTISLDPLWPVSLSNYAEVLFRVGRAADALQATERALTLRQGVYVPALGIRTQVLWALGRKEEAVAAARTIRTHLRQNPRRGADESAIWVLAQSGHAAEAEAYREEYFQTLPAGSHQWGFAFGALGRFEEALPLLERTPSLVRRRLFWDPIWDPWRSDPRFQQLLATLGCTAEYATARTSQERLLRERKTVR